MSNTKLYMGWQEEFAADMSRYNLYTPTVHITDRDIIRYGQDLTLERNIYVPLLWRGFPIVVYHYDNNGSIGIGWGAGYSGSSAIAIGNTCNCTTDPSLWLFGK